jgi:general secretion pathway protein K
MKRLPRKLGRDRGVALLLVLVGLAVLGLVANEIRYNSIVEIRLATNQRDDLRAHYLARSGVGLSRLMLKFQKQMDQIQIPNIAGMLGGLTDALSKGGDPTKAIQDAISGKGAPGAPGGGAPSTMSLQLWRMAKIDCYMLQQMMPEEDPKEGGLAPKSSGKKFEFDDENPELAQAQTKRQFGGFEGCFTTELSDEEEKINVSKLNAPQLSAQVALLQTISAFGDKKYEFLFEKEDSNRVKVVPTDIIIAMRDWLDEDEVGTQLNLSGQGDPFAKGFSDENYNYDKFDPRYRAKNAAFDSMDELYMIHGVNDRFMAAFGDKLTVFPDQNSKQNINTDDPVLLELAIRAIADPARPDPRLQDPLFIDALIKKIRTARVFAMFGMSVTDFVGIVQNAGVATNSTITNNAANNRFIGDKSNTYRIKVTGEAGDVTRTITAVIRLDDGLGRLVYWKEE